jgi:hypothetical protein
MPQLATRPVRILAAALPLAAVIAAIAPGGSEVPAAAGALRTAPAMRTRPAPPTSRPVAASGSLPGGQLFGVAATSARDAWAVGQDISSGKTIILRWNGHTWRRAPSPNPAGGGALYGVAVVSPRDAWAVGSNNAEPSKTLIERWNGSRWRRVPSPTPASGGALFGVAAISARDAWAVGCAGDCFQEFRGPIKTLILHWNGTAWKRVPSPSPSTASALSSVAAVSARSAWAVGCTAFCFVASASPQTVILRWNGTAWKREPSPAAARVGALNGVAATSARNAWAVGCTGHCFGPMASTMTMIVRWNGTAWRRVASPGPGNSVLTAVAAVSSRDAWAVGYTRGVKLKTLILHWTGTAWKPVSSPTPASGGQLFAVAASSARNAWAVGQSLNVTLLLEHWNGTAWK